MCKIKILDLHVKYCKNESSDKRLGAIKEATIDFIKKLTVFCSANGTGKTYMAYVLYAIAKLNNKSIGIRLDEEIIKKLELVKKEQKGEIERLNQKS